MEVIGFSWEPKFRLPSNGNGLADKGFVLFFRSSDHYSSIICCQHYLLFLMCDNTLGKCSISPSMEERLLWMLWFIV